MDRRGNPFAGLYQCQQQWGGLTTPTTEAVLRASRQKNASLCAGLKLVMLVSFRSDCANSSRNTNSSSKPKERGVYSTQVRAHVAPGSEVHVEQGGVRRMLRLDTMAV